MINNIPLQEVENLVFLYDGYLDVKNEEIVIVAPANALILNVKDKVLSQKIIDFLSEKVTESNLSDSIQIQEYINQGGRGEDIPILIRNSRINALNDLIKELEWFVDDQNENK